MWDDGARSCWKRSAIADRSCSDFPSRNGQQHMVDPLVDVLRWAPAQLKEDLQVALAAVASNPAATKPLG